jgi:hypothetical protein
MKSIPGQSLFRILKIFSFIILLYFVCPFDGLSQNTRNEKKIRVRMSLDYYNNFDKSRSLVASLFFIENRVRNPVANEMVVFYMGEIPNSDTMDSILTDENGEAHLLFDENLRFSVDEERFFHISADFKGNKSYTAVKSDISLKDISMELFLSEINSEKTVSVRAYEVGNDKELVPVEDAKVNFYVPRLFSDQLVGEGDFIEGKCSIKFPDNIAGDTIGNISLIARIEDHENYGNVERQIKDFRWGSTQPIEEDKSLMTIEITIPTRALWHTNAPLWMIITLIILLTGVWSHYIYVIFQLIRLKRIGKNEKMNASDGN